MFWQCYDIACDKSVMDTYYYFDPLYHLLHSFGHMAKPAAFTALK